MPAARPAAKHSSIQAILSPRAAHGLESFPVLHDVFRLPAVHGIPVLGGYDRHTGNREVLVEPVESGAGSAAAAAYDRGRRLKGEEFVAGEEDSVQEGAEDAVGAAVVDRRAHDKAVSLKEQLDSLVDGIVIEDAAAGFSAFAAGDAAVDGLVAYMNHMSRNAVFFKLSGDNAQGRVGASLRVGASIDEKNVHGYSFISSASPVPMPEQPPAKGEQGTRDSGRAGAVVCGCRFQA